MMWFSVRPVAGSKKTGSVNGTIHLTRCWMHPLGLINHMQLVRQVMRLFKMNPERLPMVWFLLGLLFNAAGLFLGFEFSVAFGYMIVGWLCCAFGIVLFVLQLMEPAKKSVEKRLSRGFISVGENVAMPANSDAKNEQAPDSSA